jgi:alkylated DNA repair dioxygenase AlkB
VDALIEEIPWEDHVLRMRGQSIPMPRRECWFAFERGVSYTYSGETYRSHALAEVPVLETLLELVQVTTGERFSALFANLYRTGSDSIGWHADAEVRALGPLDEIVIASLSLGARRRFAIRHQRTTEEHRFELGEGDLLLMGRRTQANYVHQAPKTAKPVGPRLNLTFRRLAARGGR